MAQNDIDQHSNFVDLVDEIEDILLIFKMVNFQLLESNSRDYNYLAVIEYSSIIEIYRRVVVS